MKKILLMPDSFKGTISSAEICSIMKRSIQKYYPEIEINSIPVADGGEGSVDAFLSAIGGEKIFTIVKNPYFEDMESYYGVLNHDTAVIEMAACAGLPLVENRKNPMLTTTYGVGQLISHAVKSGCKKIILGLGGSCTNDAGVGCAAALGVKFFDIENKEFIPTGGTLINISRIDLSELLPELKNIDLIAMCDIDNPLYGQAGAAAVFAPQKGADEAMIEELDLGLKHVSEVIKQDLHLDVAEMPGAGAAGGMGAGMVAFLNFKLQMGIQTVLDTVNFDHMIDGADLIFTGEGKIDSQSLRGKVVIGIAERAKAKSVPVIAVVGDVGDNIESAYEMGVTAVFSINRVAVNFSEARLRAKSDLELTMDNIMKLVQIIECRL